MTVRDPVNCTPVPVPEVDVLLLEMIALGVITFAAMLGFVAVCDRV